MKANEAPEKIYILPHEDYSDRRIFSAFTEKESNTDIEYIRKDVFIEEAWNWIEDNILSSNQQDKALSYYEQFKKYLDNNL